MRYLIIALFMMLYIIWWEATTVHWEYGSSIRIDYPAVIFMYLLPVLVVGAFFFARISNRIKFFLFTSYWLFTLYTSRIIHGPVIYGGKGYDMSSFYAIDMRADGTFYLHTASQLHQYFVSGRFTIVNDTVFLYKEWNWGYLRSVANPQCLKEGKCYYIAQPVGFNGGYAEILIGKHNGDEWFPCWWRW